MKIENIEQVNKLSNIYGLIKKRKLRHKKVIYSDQRTMEIQETLSVLDEDRVKKVEIFVLQMLDEQEKDVVKQLEEL